MNNAPAYVGLDYHNTTVQVCILDREGKVLANRPGGTTGRRSPPPSPALR